MSPGLIALTNVLCIGIGGGLAWIITAWRKDAFWRTQLDKQARVEKEARDYDAAAYDHLSTAYATLVETKATLQKEHDVAVQMLSGKILISATQAVNRRLVEQAVEPRGVYLQTVAALNHQIADRLVRYVTVTRWEDEASQNTMFSATIKLVDVMKGEAGERADVAP